MVVASRGPPSVSTRIGTNVAVATSTVSRSTRKPITGASSGRVTLRSTYDDEAPSRAAASITARGSAARAASSTMNDSPSCRAIIAATPSLVGPGSVSRPVP